MGNTFYSFIICFFLFFFALSMHDKVMDNITTNEELRQKWNAKSRAKNDNDQIIWSKTPSKCDRFKYFYFAKDSISPSRVKKYFELAGQAVERA